MNSIFGSTLSLHYRQVSSVGAAAVSVALVALSRLPECCPKRHTIELYRDAEDDSTLNDHFHACMLCFCGAFSFLDISCLILLSTQENAKVVLLDRGRYLFCKLDTPPPPQSDVILF